MKTLNTLIFFLLTSIFLTAQVDDLKKADDLGQKLFGGSESLELEFEDSYSFQNKWNYQMMLAGPALPQPQEFSYVFYSNSKDSTLVKMDSEDGSETIHDAKIGGILAIQHEEGTQCMQMRKPLVSKRAIPMIYTDAEQVEIVNGWKCKLFIYENEYHEFRLWINEDEDQSTMMRQMGTMLGLQAIIGAKVPAGLLVKFEQVRKVSQITEKQLELIKSIPTDLTIDTTPCWEVAEPQDEE